MAGSSSAKPCRPGPHAVYTLNADRSPEPAESSISSRRMPRSPKFGAMTSCNNTRAAPGAASVAARRRVSRFSSHGSGASAGPEFGTSDSRVMVVSDARNMSCRYAVRSRQRRGSASLQPAGTSPSIMSAMRSALCRHGPSGTTWCVCTSKMNSSPANAWLQATTSSGSGTTKDPPRVVVGREIGDARVVDPSVVVGAAPRPPPQALNTAKDAATPALDWRNRRRSMFVRRAARSTLSRIAAATRASSAEGGGGTNSPLDTGPGRSGKSGRPSGACAICRRHFSTGEG